MGTLSTDLALARFFGSIHDLHQLMLRQRPSTEYAASFKEEVDYLRQHMRRYDEIGQVVHHPEIYMSASQFHFYMNMKDKESAIRLLEKLRPADHQRLIHTFQAMNFPMDLSYEEACLYFAMHDGLKKLDNADVTQTRCISLILHMRKAILAFSKIVTGYEMLKAAIRSDIGLHNDIAIYAVFDEQVTRALELILSNNDISSENKIFDLVVYLLKTMDLERIKNFVNSKDSREMRKRITKLPDDHFRELKTLLLLGIDTNKKKDFTTIYQKNYNIFMMHLKDVLVSTLYAQFSRDNLLNDKRSFRMP